MISPIDPGEYLFSFFHPLCRFVLALRLRFFEHILANYCSYYCILFLVSLASQHVDNVSTYTIHFQCTSSIQCTYIEILFII
jgi:hypothetical protein